MTVGWAAVASPARRVLMVFREDGHVPATRMIEAAVRTSMSGTNGEDFEFYTEYLDVNRFANGSHYRLFREYLQEKYLERRPEVMVTVLTPAFDLAGVPPGELLPGVPVVFIAVTGTALPSRSLGSNVTGIVARPDFSGTLGAMMRLQPETERVVVIGGVTSSERALVAQVELAAERYEGRLKFEFWTNRPIADLRAGVASLSDRTAVLFVSLFRDANGAAFLPAQALESLVGVARAPIYVWTDSQLGSGAVGGVVVDYDQLGDWAGGVALRVINGAPIASQSVVVLTNGTPLFDWRAMQRWKISERRLPPGSQVDFRQPNFLESHWRMMLGAAIFICLQAVLILGLLINRTKLREAESVATLTAELSSKFVHLPSSEVDREIEVAQRRVCEKLGLDLATLWQWTDETPRYFTMTHIYRPLGGPPLPERIDAEELFPYAVRELSAWRIVAFSTIEELPTGAVRDREVYRHYGIKSGLSFPLTTGGGELIGTLSFNTVRAERAWPEQIIKRLQVVAQIFANALARKRAEAALRASEARLAAAVDVAALGFYEMRPASGQVFVDDRLRALLGTTLEEEARIYEIWLERVHPDDREPVVEMVRKLRQGEVNTVSTEYRYLHPDSGQRWFYHVARAQERNVAGQATRLLGVIRDITHQKQSEMESQEMRSNLAHSGRVTMLGQLSSALAHELSQPLGAILRNAEAAELMLQMPEPDLAEVRAIVADILRDDRRAGNVIERLRSLLKRRRLELQPVELNSLIGEILSLVQADAAARRVKLECALEQNLPKVRGDRVHLQQVVLNLLMNAMDASAEAASEGRCVQVTTRLTNAHTIEVRVSDQGPGIPGDSPEHLFVPFFTTKANGMGVGLPVSRTIVEAHAGRIWGENRPGGGACFCFTLPTVEPAIEVGTDRQTCALKE